MLSWWQPSGPDTPDTALWRVSGPFGEVRASVTTAPNLAIRLADAGRVEEACAMGEDTLARQRRVLGEDHPDPSLSALGETSRSAGLA